MDILAGLRQAIDAFWYNIILSLAGLHWSLLRGLIMMGHTIEVINEWLLENAFAPLIAQTNASLNVAVTFAFVIALLVLGITYMLAAFVRLEVVNFRSAMTWYIAGALFFALGPALYQGLNDFRTSIAQGFYLSTLQGLQDTIGDSFSSLDQVESNDLPLGPLCDYLGVYLPGATGPGGIDGLDVAIAFLRADGPDVMGYPQPVLPPDCPPHLFHPGTGDYISQVPQEWFFEDSYFDFLQSPNYFDEMTDEERAASISMASSAHSRMFTAWPLVLFGVVEQIVYLLITIAMGITFISFSMAILFAFFKKTEVIARSIVDQWIELIVQTVVIAMVQSLVVAFFLAGTASGNGMVSLGIGLICLIFMLIVLWSGVKAVWNSLNRLFNAMGQATGGVIVAPGSAAATAAASGAAAAGGAVSVGSNALAGMTALNRGATVSQASGIMFGGSPSLSSAARMLAYLPGVRGTSLGESAEQFSEGAITRQIARHVPVVGRAAGPLVAPYLLTDRDPEASEYDEYGRVLSRPMLVPAVGEGLERFTVPPGARRRRPVAGAPEFIEGEEGEFTPARPRRMGTFTPVVASPQDALQAAQVGDDAGEEQRQEQSTYAAEMHGEEMEQHISDVMQTSTGTASPLSSMLERDQQQDDLRLNQMAARLEASADALLRAAQMQMMVGRLRVSGSQDVAGVMGDVIQQTRSEREQNDQPLNAGLDHLQAAEQVAQVMGVTPVESGPPPVQQDLARFGLFIDRALQMGLTAQQTEQVVQEVKVSPSGELAESTREALVEQVREERNLSWNDAQQEVGHLERYADNLPESITAFGMVRVPTEAAQAAQAPPQVDVIQQLDVQPQVAVEVEPDIQVTVQQEQGSDYDDAMRRESALGGSGNVIGGEST